MVSAATDTAVSASISTPVCAVVRTRASMTYPFFDGVSSTLMCVSGSGWHSGMSDEVCFAARMPASFAACSGSPFATSPLRINFSAAALIVIDPRATASRAVAGLAPTSTIVTRPRSSTCVSLTLPLLPFSTFPLSLATVVPLREVERQALERHREVHALQLHIVRHVQRARREVENPLDAGGNDLIDDGLRMRRGDGDDGDIEPLTPRDALQLLDVVDRHAAARFVPDLLARRIEERGNLEAFLAEAGIVGEREAEVAGAEDGDAQAAVEAEDLTQVAAQLFHVIADAADTELTEVCEVLANLRGVEMELLGQALRGNRLHAGGVELV